MFWDTTCSGRSGHWVVTRPVTDQWSLNVVIIRRKIIYFSRLVDLYCWSTRSHFTRKDSRLSENRKSFPPQAFPSYCKKEWSVHTTPLVWYITLWKWQSHQNRSSRHFTVSYITSIIGEFSIRMCTTHFITMNMRTYYTTLFTVFGIYWNHFASYI